MSRLESTNVGFEASKEICLKTQFAVLDRRVRLMTELV